MLGVLSFVPNNFLANEVCQIVRNALQHILCHMWAFDVGTFVGSTLKDRRQQSSRLVATRAYDEGMSAGARMGTTTCL